jgi:hypothetical protein
MFVYMRVCVFLCLSSGGSVIFIIRLFGSFAKRFTTAFLFSAFVGTDGARVTHVKLTFPPGERDYTTLVPTFIILCAHTHTYTHSPKFIYYIHNTRMCAYMAFLTDEIQFNIILTVFFFSVSFIYLFFSPYH